VLVAREGTEHIYALRRLDGRETVFRDESVSGREDIGGNRRPVVAQSSR